MSTPPKSWNDEITALNRAAQALIDEGKRLQAGLHDAVLHRTPETFRRAATAEVEETWKNMGTLLVNVQRAIDDLDPNQPKRPERSTEPIWLPASEMPPAPFGTSIEHLSKRKPGECGHHQV